MSKSRERKTNNIANGTGEAYYFQVKDHVQEHNDSGGSSRFFQQFHPDTGPQVKTAAEWGLAHTVDDPDTLLRHDPNDCPEEGGTFTLVEDGGEDIFAPDTGPGFRYQAKASRAERNKGLEGMPEKPSYMVENGSKTAGSANGKRYERHTVHQNNHPTVKSVSLMRYLVRMVTPPEGTVLDPFVGSGSTLVAAIHEGFDCIGIEAEPEYVEICRARVRHALENPEL